MFALRHGEDSLLFSFAINDGKRETIVFTAMPTDVRRWLRPAVSALLKFGAAPRMAGA